jgi:hypothetical protein
MAGRDDVVYGEARVWIVMQPFQAIGGNCNIGSVQNNGEVDVPQFLHHVAARGEAEQNRGNE